MVMKANKNGIIPSTKAGERIQALREILRRERGVEYARIRQLRRDEADDAVPGPSDDLDIARSQLDTELHVSLIERSEEQLKAIDDAESRLDQGLYGVCEQCGVDIPLQRLGALPFTVCCVDCQGKRETGRERGTIPAAEAKRWTVPRESSDRDDTLAMPEEQVRVHENSPFGPETELEMEPAVERRPRRARKRPPRGS
jgi:RNA polymerase-binding transcription factor